MKSIAIEISDSTYHKIRCLGSTDVGSINRIAAAALADYLHGDVGWLGAASYPLRKSGQSTHISISAFTLQLQELGIGMTPPGAPVVILDGHLYRIGANGTAVQITEDVSVPYAMMVNFEAETLRNDFEGASIDALVDHCESLGREATYSMFSALTDASATSLCDLRLQVAAEFTPTATAPPVVPTDSKMSKEPS